MPEINKRIRPHLRKTNDSYRIDETHIKIKGEWNYLYRAAGDFAAKAQMIKLFAHCSQTGFYVPQAFPEVIWAKARQRYWS